MPHDWLTRLLGIEPLLLIGIALVGLLLIILLHNLFYHSRLFAVCPKVVDYGNRLIARTSLAGWLLSLTLIYRKVIVDAQRKAFVIRRRLFWFYLSTVTIPFEHIQEIKYDYEDWGPYTSLGFTGDSKDCFSVKLQLVDDSEVHLFNFIGEGGFEPGLINPLFSLRWFLAKILLAF